MLVSPSFSPAVFTGTTGIGAWKILSRNLDQRLQMFARDPAIAREVDYFRQKIGSVGSAAALVGDQRLFEVALSAYDLEGQENAHGLMRRVLGEDLSDPRATANRMVDDRYRKMAGDFGFAGGAGDSDRALLDKTVSAYLRTTFEQRTGQTLPRATTELQDAMLEALAAEPVVAAEIAHFRKAMGSIAGVEEVVKDQRLIEFAYRAAGFEGKRGLSAELVGRAIEDKDFRAGLGDARWDRLASTFAAAQEGRRLRVGSAEAQIDAVVDRWVKASFTLETGRQTGGAMSADLEESLEIYAARPDVAAKTAEFKAQIARSDSAASLLAKPAAHAFVLRAFGLDDYRRNADMFLRTLQESPDSSSSPAAFDSRFKALAEGMSFLGKDSRPATTDPKFVDQVVESYVRVQFERFVGAGDLGMRQALYAQRKLPSVTTPYQITADMPLRQFVLPAVGIPANSGQDIDRLVRDLRQRVDMGRLREPAYLEKLTQRFFANTAGIGGAFGSPASTAGIGVDLLLQTQGRR